MLVCFYGKIEQQEYDGDWSQLKASGERLIEIFIWKETDRHVWHFDLKVHCVGFSGTKQCLHLATNLAHPTSPSLIVAAKIVKGPR